MRAVGSIWILTVALAAAIAAPGGLIQAPAAAAATISVTTEDDALANDGACSLREAITAALTGAPSGAAAGECPAGEAGADTVTLPSGVFAIAPLAPNANPEDNNLRGDFDLAGPLTIRGANSGATVVTGNTQDRVFDVVSGVARLVDLTVTGGLAYAGPFPGPGADGGGIRNAGALTLLRVRVAANSAGAGGAGSDSTPAGPGANAAGGAGAAGGDGGGIYNEGAASALTVVESVISANEAGKGGQGGLADGGEGTTGENGGSAVGGAGGAGGSGGGIGGEGTVELRSSRVTGNRGGSGGNGRLGLGGSGGDEGGTGAPATGGPGGGGGGGGGIQSAGAVSIEDSSITDNAAGAGGSGGTAIGGRGGDGTVNFSAGWHGAIGSGGLGGAGGSGGGVLAGDSLAIERSTIAGNLGGVGGGGGIGSAGSGGDAVGNGNGGVGSNGIGGSGGAAGRGAGLASTAPSEAVTIVNSTISGNENQPAGLGSIGTGGPGGDGAGTGDGGAAGPGFGGAGGAGGNGAALFGGAATAHDLRQLTAAANLSSPGANGGPGSGGLGGAGSSPGVDGVGSNGPAGASPSGAIAIAGGTLTGSLLAGPANCAQALTDGGGNIDFPPSLCPGQTTDPKLGALGDHGGPTQTRVPGTGSPALDAIASESPVCAATDQRGVPRPQLGGCDIGAYEVAPPAAITGDAVELTENGATLTGTIDPHLRQTTYRFEFGVTTAYGQLTPEATASEQGPIEAALTGLAPGTLFHYRLLATNADGSTTGADGSFTTAEPQDDPLAFGEQTLVRVGLAKKRIPPKGPLKARVRNDNEFEITGQLGAKTAKKVRTARKARIKLKPKPLELGAGARTVVKLKLPKPLKRILRRTGKLSLRLSAKVTDPAGNTRKVKKKAKVKLKRKRR